MKVLYDYQTFARQKFGGISRYFVELLSNLDGEIKVYHKVLFSQNYYLYDRFGIKQWNIKNKAGRYGSLVLNDITTFLHVLFQAIKGKPYDIVHITWYKAGYLKPILFLLGKKRPKVVTTIYDLIHEMEQNQKPVYKRGVKDRIKTLKLADEIICISENTKKDLLSYYPWVDKNKVHVVYLAATPVEQKTIEDIPDNYVLFVGRRSGYKNFDVVLRAMSSVIKEYPDTKLFCVGGGSLSEEERNRINQLGLQNSVFQRSLSDEELAFSYAYARCFVFSSKYEGFGIPILEAFTYGCPTILSNASCFPEIAGEAAIYFEPDDEKQLSNHIIKCINSLQHEFVQKGKNRSELFSWTKTAEETKRCYRMLVDNNNNLDQK